MRGPTLVLCAIATLATGCAILPGVERSVSERWAFSVPWDARSIASARAHGGALDALVLDWIALDTISGLPLDRYDESQSSPIAPSARPMALLTSYVGSEFHPAVIRRLAVDSTMLKRTSQAIVERLQRRGSRGLIIDFEGMTGRDTALTRSVVATIASATRARGLGPVVVAIPAADTVGYPARLFEASADLLLVKLYDQHTANSPAGAISAPDWVRRSLATRVSESGARRLVAALPTYGYLWRAGRTPASAVSWDEGRRLAAESGVALERDPATSTLRAVRPGSDGWELWMTDAVLLAAVQREVAALNVRRVAYWRLGLEDPALWATVRR